jgi:hypothetical protein
MAEYRGADGGDEGNRNQDQNQRLYHLVYGLFISLAFVAADFAFLWPENHLLALLFLAATLSGLAIYEMRVVYRLPQPMIELSIFGILLACGAVYFVVGPNQVAPTIGWLQPANEPTPPNGCDRLPAIYQGPKGPIIILADSGFIPGNSANVAAIQIGQCAPVMIRQGPNGIMVSADIYSPQGELVGQIRDNGYTMSGEKRLAVEKSGDLSTLVVHDAQRTELLYVRYLNPNAIRVRGVLSCPVPRLITVPITNDRIIVPGNNVIMSSCSTGGVVGVKIN